MLMRMMMETSLLRGRALAKEGRDLPDDRASASQAEIQMGNGETYDFDFTPSETGDLRLDVTNAAGGLLVSMPIHVR